MPHRPDNELADRVGLGRAGAAESGQSRSVGATGLDEAELVAVGVADRELARSVLCVHQRFEDIGIVAEAFPPAIDVSDFEIQSSPHGRSWFVLTDRELRWTECEVRICWDVRRPVPLRRHAEEPLIPRDGGVEVANVDANVREARNIHSDTVRHSAHRDDRSIVANQFSGIGCQTGSSGMPCACRTSDPSARSRTTPDSAALSSTSTSSAIHSPSGDQAGGAKPE